MKKKEYIAKNLDELDKITKKIILEYSNQSLFCLYGDLGAGKTTTAYYLVKNLIGESAVTSPTYNILNIYNSEKIKIFHYDLYRLKHVEEINEIGLLDQLDEGITIIEWPEISHSFISKIERVNIKIKITRNYIRNIYVELLK